MLSEKDLGENGMNHPKSRSSSKEGRALYLVELERDPVCFYQTTINSEKYCFPIKRIEDRETIQKLNKNIQK